MVIPKLPKLEPWVRFPSPAPLLLVLVPLEQARFREVRDKSGVRSHIVDEGENLRHVRRDMGYWPDPDLVAVNRFAKLTVSQAVTHDIRERLCCFAGCFIGTVTVMRTLCPSGRAPTSVAFKSPVRRRTTLSNRSFSFAVLTLSPISRSMVVVVSIRDLVSGHASMSFASMKRAYRNIVKRPPICCTSADESGSQSIRFVNQSRATIAGNQRRGMCCCGCSDEGVVCTTPGHRMFRQRQDKILIQWTLQAKERLYKACSEKVSNDRCRTTMRRRQSGQH